jgi:hypothetical protein
MLKYIGNGSFIPGIPARDLTTDEVQEYARDYEFKGKRGADGLIASGLYERSTIAKEKKTFDKDKEA